MKRREAMPDIPVKTEEQLLEEKWTCSYCHGKTRGPECEYCGEPRRDAMIVVPENCDEDVMERLTTDKRCGNCKHFDLRMGQERINDPKDPLYLRMIHEMEVKSITQNMNWKELGVCKMWTESGKKHMLTSASAPARCAKKHVDSSVPYRQKDRNVPCPAYDPVRSSDGKQIKSYRMVPGSRTHGTD